LKILDFDDGNDKYRVIEDADYDSDDDFAFGLSLAQLGHKLWPDLKILDFDDEDVKYRVIEDADYIGYNYNGFAFA
jgi:hypothetical protein